MQIIIDTEIIKDLIEHEWGYEGVRDDLDEIFEKHGTSIPKGHGRLIDAKALEDAMYHEAFEVDSDLQRWDSGNWIRYKMFENAIHNAPTIIGAERDRT